MDIFGDTLRDFTEHDEPPEPGQPTSPPRLAQETRMSLTADLAPVIAMAELIDGSNLIQAAIDAERSGMAEPVKNALVVLIDEGVQQAAAAANAPA